MTTGGINFDLSSFDSNQLRRWMEQAQESKTVRKRGTVFTIQQLLAMEGFRVWEPLRVELFERASRMPLTVSGNSMIALVGVLLSVSESTLDRVRSKLFEQVLFTNQNAQTPMVLAGNENMAFNGLETVHVYEVLVKCLVINFTPSLLELLSLMDRIPSTSPPPPTAT